MPTKINQDYYGQEANWSTVIGSSGYIKHSPHNIERLMTNNIYQGGNFDMTAAPWGIGKSSASSDMEFIATHDAKWHIYKLDRQKGNTPMFLYINSTTYEGALSTADLVGLSDTSVNYELALFRSRVSPDAEYNSGLKSTLALDAGTGVEFAHSTQNLPILALDYRYVRLYIDHVYYKPVGENTIKSCKMDDIEAGRVNVDCIAYFDCHLCYNRANGTTPVTTNVHCSIGGNEVEIPHLFKDVYYQNASEDNYVRPYRYIERFGYWGIDTNWYSGDSFRYGNDNYINTQTEWTTLGNSNFVKPNVVGQGWCNASTVEQSFSDGIKYKWNYGIAPYDANQWLLNEYADGDSYDSSVAFRSFAYMELTEIPAGMTKNMAYFYAILHEVAFLGFPIALNYISITHNFGEGDVYLPVFDEHQITTGEFKNGAESLTLPNASWQDIFSDTMPEYDPTYDPDPPSGDDEDEGIKVRPSTPGFTLAGRGTECYELLESDIDEIFDDIYGRDNRSWNKLIKGLQMFGSDPMGAIISFKWYPFTFIPGESKAVYLGNTAVNPLHQYPTTDGITKSYVSTTATFKWDKPKNFVNSRYTKCRIYLPFYGFYELPISMMISKTLSVYMAYNVPDETAVWILSFDDVIYDFCECDPSIEIPLTGSNAGQIALVKRQAALSIAAQVAAIAGTAIVGTQAGSGLAYLGYTASDSLVFSGALSPGIAEDVTKTLNAMAGRSVAGAGVSGLSNLGNIYNTVQNAKLQIGTLQTNLPHHGAASATTFLNLPMFPYIQFIQNIKMQGYNQEQYKLKVGHACDIWTTMDEMPENSLLQTTGMADMSSMSMELPEITELNSILQTGFYK